MRKRCALGCPQRGVPSHVFPNPKKFPEAFKAWVELIGGKLNTASDYKFYRKKIICDIHFTPNDKNRNNRLNCLAVPSLFLPNKPVTSAEVETDITSSSAIVDVCQPSSSIAIPLESAEEDMINVAPRTIDLDIAPATSSGSVDDPFLEHNYFKRELVKDARQCRKNVPRKKVPALVLQKYKSYRRQIKNLKTQLRRTRKQTQNFKARQASAEKMTNDAAFIRMTKNLSTEAKIFIKMQCSQAHKAPSGRCFSLEDKILSLSLYKRSRKYYNFLAKQFTLPSGKTLKTLLSEIKIKSGINDLVFDKIKETVQGMNPSDRLCSVLFDEMALTPSVNYDSKSDELKGFSNLQRKKHLQRFASQLTFLVAQWSEQSLGMRKMWVRIPPKDSQNYFKCVFTFKNGIINAKTKK